MSRHAKPVRLWPLAAAATVVGTCGLIAAATHAAPRVVAQPADPPPAAVVERYEVTDLVRLPVVASPSESVPVQDVAEKPLSEPVTASQPAQGARTSNRPRATEGEPLTVSRPEAVEQPPVKPTPTPTKAAAEPAPTPAETSERTQPTVTPTPTPTATPTKAAERERRHRHWRDRDDWDRHDRDRDDSDETTTATPTATAIPLPTAEIIE